MERQYVSKKFLGTWFGEVIISGFAILRVSFSLNLTKPAFTRSFFVLSSWCRPVGAFDQCPYQQQAVSTRLEPKAPTKCPLLWAVIGHRFSSLHISRSRFNPNLYSFQHTVNSSNSKTRNTINSCIKNSFISLMTISPYSNYWIRAKPKKVNWKGYHRLIH